jgi:hypothetical protein
MAWAYYHHRPSSGGLHVGRVSCDGRCAACGSSAVYPANQPLPYRVPSCICLLPLPMRLRTAGITPDMPASVAPHVEVSE